MNRVFTLLLVLGPLFLNSLFSQQVVQHKFSLAWSAEDPLSFENAGEFAQNPILPVYTYRFPLAGASELTAVISVLSSEVISITDPKVCQAIPAEYYIGAIAEQERGKWYGRVWLMPLISSSNQKAKRINSGVIHIEVKPEPNINAARTGPEFKETSVLSSGVIHKVAVSKSGIYKIDYAYIRDQLKIDPSTFTTDRIAIFGNGDGRVPQWNSAPRIDDLEQSSSLGVGFDDGQFNQGDYLLWYAEGPDAWSYDPVDRIYNMEKNNYNEVNHYYIIINGPQRQNIESRSNGTGGEYASESSLRYQRLEEEKVNLLGRFRPPGSGQEWYGDEMAVINQLDYTSRFDLTDLIPTDTFYYKVRFAARAANLTRFYIQFDQKETSRNVGGVDLGNYESSFANDALLQGKFIPETPIQLVKVRYPDANGINSRAWIDYIQLNHWSKNQYRQGSALLVRDPRSLYAGNPVYTIDGLPAGGLIWDITNPLVPVLQEYNTGSRTTFVVTDQTIIPKEFICFNPAQDVNAPTYSGVVTNQNLHSIQNADLLIVYYDEFEEAGMTLATHRQIYSNLDVVAVPVSQVYEEFGGGSKDPSALRDFARMLYKRDPDFKYLLLLGDATYDYLNRFTNLPYHNFIPAFETEESLDPIRSFPSDDYFALLDDDEGDNLIGAIDIAVGRLPVTSPEEALAIVNKVIYYDTNPATLNDWRLRSVMVADDEDGNIHLNQADGLAVETDVKHPELNVHKIYLDAYPQETTPGGDRYPSVNEDIDLNMKKGALTVTYIGHGGQNGWTQERVLGINQAQSYDNKDNMPLFITATCSFAGYDEPGFTTAGEHLLTNPDGGAIGLMTTVRAVYSGSNERLTDSVLDRVYNPDSPGEYPSIAEILRRAKNSNALDTLDNNARKFTLLGDPSMTLAHPRYFIAVTEIVGNPDTGGTPDTLSALEKTRVSGHILDDKGEILTDFNGKVFLTLFDKVQVRKTLANDEGSIIRPFNTQTRQLFKGTATVEAGVWTIEFVLPKDLDFTFGPGKMSLYAHNGITDAGGVYKDFIVGGVSEEGLSDDQPPVVQLFMNDDNFVSGGITDRNPDIYIKLSDDNGINATGTSVGHDIEAILDNDDRNSLILNDFYQASLDDYTRGEVRYPLQNLAAGLHTLKVTAWDLANNPGEAYLEFLVLDHEGAILEHVFNYPNPFGTSTNFQFEHNRPGAVMDIQIRIFTINGQLVKTIRKEGFISDGYRVDDLEWAGENEMGSQLTSGIYIYKIKVAYTLNGNKDVVESNAEKLVLLR
jgi:Peptidase family C25